MGFGTLFIGYFLLLNIAFFGFTDLIVGLILLLALYKLMTVDPSFKKAAILLVPFSVLGLAELVLEIYRMFTLDANLDTVFGIFGMLRYLLLAPISYLILYGIETLAKEVEIANLRDKARWVKFASLTAFSLSMILEIPQLDSILAPKALAVISFIVLLSGFIITIVALTAIYSAYMNICMPDEVYTENKPSRFGFVNKFRDYESKKQQEYAEYKLEKIKSKANKKKKGKK